MQASIDDLAVYLHLARANERRQRHLLRDKLLVLAAVAAARRKLDIVAHYCRQKILLHNPAHLVGHWPSLASALGDDDFLYYVGNLARRYPLEKAEHMLGALGIEMARERALYVDDQEYAAAILGTSPAGLSAELRPQRTTTRESAASATRQRPRRGLAARVKALVRLLR